MDFRLFFLNSGGPGDHFRCRMVEIQDFLKKIKKYSDFDENWYFQNISHLLYSKKIVPGAENLFLEVF